MSNNIYLEPNSSSTNTNNKPILEFDDSVKIKIILQFSYSTHEKTIENYNVRIEEKKQILLNEIIDDLIGQGYSYLNNSAMSYFDQELQTYIYLGVAPLQANIKLNFDYLKYKNNNKEVFIVNSFLFLNFFLTLFFFCELEKTEKKIIKEILFF